MVSALSQYVERPLLESVRQHRLIIALVLQHMLMGMSVPLVFGSADEIGKLESPELDGWDSMEPRNVFYKEAPAEPDVRVRVGIPFREIEPETTGENLGEEFGVRPVIDKYSPPTVYQTDDCMVFIDD